MSYGSNLAHNKADVVILIINWNGFAETSKCLSSLKDFMSSQNVVVLIDNGSKAGEGDRLKENFPWIDLLKSDKNLGFTGGNNLGFQYAKEKYDPDYYLLLNNDTEIRSDFISPMIKLCAAHKTIGIVGCNILDYRNGLVQSSGIKVNKWTGSTTHLKNGADLKIGKLDAVSGCCMLVAKDVTEKIGYLDDDYFCYYEEIDYCTRAKLCGYYPVVCQKAEIFHLGQVSSSRVTGFHETQMIKNRFMFVKKNCNLIQKISVFFYVTFLYIPIRLFSLTLKKQFRAGFKYFIMGYIKGIKILFDNKIS